MKKVSIIIPAYNTSKFIERCLDSILCSITDEFEIIVIDDASTDDTFKILQDKYNNKIVLLHNDINSGVSYSRNKGIRIAKGQYIVFVDSDDYVSNDYCNVILSVINSKENFDIVIYNFYNSKIKKRKFPPKRINQLLFLFENDLFGWTWNKIVKKEILLKNKITFDENLKICEDQLFYMNYFEFVSKIIFLEKPLYFYYQRPNSAMSAKYSDDVRQLVYMQKKEFFIKENLFEHRLGKKVFADYCLNILLCCENKKSSIIANDCKIMIKYASLFNKLRYIKYKVKKII